MYPQELENLYIKQLSDQFQDTTLELQRDRTFNSRGQS